MNSLPPFAANTNESEHPALESIAAYLDGRLPEAERSALTAHLDSCAACYEIYTESLRFQKAENEETQRGVLPFEPRKTWLPPNLLRNIALPFAALLLVGVGASVWYQLNRPLEPRSIDSYTASLENPGAITEKLDPFDRQRGVEESTGNPPIVAFHSGATLVDLRVAIAANDTEKISDLAGNLRVLLNYISFVSEQDKSTLETAVEHLGSEKAPPGDRKLTDFGSLETILRNNNADEMAPHFELGAWTEAGRLASYGNRAGFFADSGNRKSLRWFRRHLPQPELPNVQEALEKIDGAWPEGPLDRVSRTTLAAGFGQVIDSYDVPLVTGIDPHPRRPAQPNLPSRAPFLLGAREAPASSRVGSVTRETPALR